MNQADRAPGVTESETPDMYFEWPILIINVVDLLFWLALLVGVTVILRSLLPWKGKSPCS